jgi:hypothetical protein
MELGADKQYSKEKKVPVALAGRVPVKVDLEGGPINIGDRITLSLRNPGVGMKASAGDNTIGIALQSFSGLENGISTSVDSILVFVQNQQTRIDSSGAMGDGEISGLTPASILNSLSSLQADLMSGMVALKQLVLDRITVGVARVNKLEMVDSLSGDIYCTWMENGEWKKAKGECVVDMVAINTASQSSVSNREVMSLQRQVDQLQEQNNQQDEQIQEVQEQVQEQVEQQPQSLNIVSVAALTEKEVPYGTETELLDLPTNVQVAFSDNSQHNLSVIWDSGTPVYDKNTPGVYTFSGTLIFSGNITNNNNVSVVLNITVAQDINVTTGEIINDAGANLLTGAINFVKWLFGPDSKSSTIKKVSADLIDGFAFVQSWIFEEMQYLQHGVGALLKPFENFLKID